MLACVSELACASALVVSVRLSVLVLGVFSEQELHFLEVGKCNFPTDDD